jgi:hypothetical protein
MKRGFNLILGVLLISFTFNFIQAFSIPVCNNGVLEALQKQELNVAREYYNQMKIIVEKKNSSDFKKKAIYFHNAYLAVLNRSIV